MAHDLAKVRQLIAELVAAVAALDEAGELHLLGEEAVQGLFAAAARAYLAAVLNRADAETVPPPVGQGHGLTATDCAILANELLKVADMDVFELGMFRQFGTY